MLATLAIPLLFVLARSFLPPWPSLLAAAWLATSLNHLLFSQEARPHAPHLTFVLLALVATLALARRPGLARSLAAGGACALACATLQTGGFTLAALVAAHVAPGVGDAAWKRRRWFCLSSPSRWPLASRSRSSRRGSSPTRASPRRRAESTALRCARAGSCSSWSSSTGSGSRAASARSSCTTLRCSSRRAAASSCCSRASGRPRATHACSCSPRTPCRTGSRGGCTPGCTSATGCRSTRCSRCVPPRS
ncbi:MAG: hypothetical protein IPJ77_05500 [Planctomycetes bacterium]|nr:hypothetical protein [Planctomycetota bacterium]